MKRVYDEEMEEGEDQGNDGIITLTTTSITVDTWTAQYCEDNLLHGKYCPFWLIHQLTMASCNWCQMVTFRNEQGRTVYTSRMIRVTILYTGKFLWENIQAYSVEGLQFMKISSAIIAH